VSGTIRIKIALALTYMLFAVLLNSVGTVILQSIHSFEVTKIDASLLEAFKDLSIVCASFVAASLVPRLGYRISMIAALGLVGCACLLMPAFPGFHTTELLFATVGVSFAVTKIAVYSSFGLLTNGSSEHASLTNVIEGMFMVGMLSGYWIFSAFIDVSGAGSLAWLHVYWVLAGICAVAMLLLATSRLDETAATSGTAGTVRASLVELQGIAARPLVYVFLFSAFLYVLIEQSVGTWLPTFNREVLGLPNVMSVQIASIFAGMLAIGRLCAGVLLRRISWYALLNGCVAAMAALIVLTLPLAAQVHPNERVTWLTAPAAAYLFPLFGLFMAPIYPVINSVALSALPKRVHATMTGLIVVFSALGGTSGSRVTAIVFGEFGGQRAFYFSLIPVALMLGVLYLFKQQVEQAAVRELRAGMA
jgi:MFS transporter, FHS family, glucose/mannose:H+ symporter